MARLVKRYNQTSVITQVDDLVIPEKPVQASLMKFETQFENNAIHMFNFPLEKVHRIYHTDIYDFSQSILANDYSFYDLYEDVPELLFLGSTNSGKSSLINSLNSKKK